MRGRGRGRGRGGNPPRRHQPPPQPYISSELQKINMELELLREKKTIIENHQHAIQDYRSYNQFQRDYNAMPYLYVDLSHETPGPSRPSRSHSNADGFGRGYISNTKAKKRRAESWANANAKRMAGPDRTVVQSIGPRKGPKANMSQNQKKKQPLSSNDEMFLRSDREPTARLRGRMQLGLGHILKNMKHNFSKQEKFYAMLFVHPYLNNIKMEMRKRLYSVMKNKLVTTPQEIARVYREFYPVESDVEFLKQISREISVKTSKPDILSEFVVTAPMNPHIYRNVELPYIIDAELDETFRKLEILYDSNLTEAQKTEKLSKDKITPISRNHTIPDEEKTEEVIAWKREMHKKIHKMVPKILFRNVKHITKLMKMDLVYINTCTNVMNRVMEAGDTEDINLEVNEGTGVGMPQFCAKVQGHPILPNTTVMRDFLDEFNPVWVKKKKMTRNTLFVSFRDEESLQKLIEKSGTEFGDCYVKITRVVNKSGKVKKRNGKIPDEQKDEPSLDISANIDDQISDLIKSIKKAEENNEILIEDSDTDPEDVREFFTRHTGSKIKELSDDELSDDLLEDIDTLQDDSNDADDKQTNNAYNSNTQGNEQKLEQDEGTAEANSSKNEEAKKSTGDGYNQATEKPGGEGDVEADKTSAKDESKVVTDKAN